MGEEPKRDALEKVYETIKERVAGLSGLIGLRLNSGLYGGLYSGAYAHEREKARRQQEREFVGVCEHDIARTRDCIDCILRYCGPDARAKCERMARASMGTCVDWAWTMASVEESLNGKERMRKIEARLEAEQRKLADAMDQSTDALRKLGDAMRRHPRGKAKRRQGRRRHW